MAVKLNKRAFDFAAVKEGRVVARLTATAGASISRPRRRTHSSHRMGSMNTGSGTSG